jgi:hypothetical protein
VIRRLCSATAPILAPVKDRARCAFMRDTTKPGRTWQIRSRRGRLNPRLDSDSRASNRPVQQRPTIPIEARCRSRLNFTERCGKSIRRPESHTWVSTATVQPPILVNDLGLRRGADLHRPAGRDDVVGDAEAHPAPPIGPHRERRDVVDDARVAGQLALAASTASALASSTIRSLPARIRRGSPRST